MEHTYARSMARFAAKLGPIAWAIASRRLERVLPPGTKFGRGWVGDGEPPQQSKLITCSTSAGGTKPLEEQEPPSTDSNIEEGHSKSSLTPVPTSSESRFDTQDVGGDKTPSSWPRPNSAIQPGVNGVSTPSSFKLSKTASINSELPMTHARALDMVSRGNNNVQFRHQTLNDRSDAVMTASVSNPGTVKSKQDSKRTSSIPPDLNAGSQHAGSPSSGVIVESHQPDLALQL